MLVLGRKVAQSIVLEYNGEIIGEIAITDIRGRNEVRIGFIDFSKDIHIHRKEKLDLRNVRRTKND